MAEQRNLDICPAQPLADALAVIERDDEKGLQRLRELLGEFPRDPRLHFLEGSLLAGRGRYDEARRAMTTSVQIAPDYEIARFQLGFLELTSGLAEEAIATWRPLLEPSPRGFLGLFARGLEHLARDRFDEAVADLRDGMAQNRENPNLNNDMQLVIDKVAELKGQEQGETSSATHLLLQQYGAKPTKH
jgi:tetratricopeptide (TPR) repeat protein